MEPAAECNHARPARRGARDLDGVFNSLRAGREERGLLCVVAGCARDDLLGERNIRFVRDDLIRRMREALELRAHGRDNFRVPMSRVAYRDARREVDETAAFYIPQFSVFGTFGVEITHHADTAWRRGILAGFKVGVLQGLAHGIAPWRVDRYLTVFRRSLDYSKIWLFQSEPFSCFYRSHFRNACKHVVRLAGSAD